MSFCYAIKEHNDDIMQYVNKAINKYTTSYKYHINITYMKQHQLNIELGFGFQCCGARLERCGVVVRTQICIK